MRILRLINSRWASFLPIKCSVYTVTESKLIGISWAEHRHWRTFTRTASRSILYHPPLIVHESSGWRISLIISGAPPSRTFRAFILVNYKSAGLSTIYTRAMRSFETFFWDNVAQKHLSGGAVERICSEFNRAELSILFLTNVLPRSITWGTLEEYSKKHCNNTY